MTRLLSDRSATLPLLSTDQVPAIVTLKPGESACFEVELRGREIRPVRAVAVGQPGARTISVSFASTGGGHALRVRHSERQAVRYTASLIFPFPSGKFGFKPTSTCPVAAGMFTMEFWEEPLSTLILAGFHFAEDDLGCHE